MVSLLSLLPTQTATQQPREQVLSPPHSNCRQQQVQPLFPEAPEAFSHQNNPQRALKPIEQTPEPTFSKTGAVRLIQLEN